MFIGIEDLAANAIIVLFNEKKVTSVSFEELAEYGAKVVDILKTKGEEAVLIYTKDATSALERNYSNYFTVFMQDQKQYVKLKDGVTIEDVIKKYRTFLSINALLAFIDKEAMAILGVA